MALLFRLYGDFSWPPRPDVHLARKQSGTVEVFYVLKEGDSSYHAYLRWVPKGIEPAEDALPENNIYEVSDPVKWFEDRSDKVASIWIDSPTEGAPNGVRVAFRGAFLIDQYKVSEEVDEIRWPLVQHCEYERGKTVYSELVVYRTGEGREQESVFRFNLHLPLPVPRTNLGGAQDIAAFPFCAVYATSLPSNRLGKILALVGGWVGSNRTSFEFKNETFPEKPFLGKFGFAARAKRSDRGFAVYEGNRHGGTRPANVDVHDFWPRKAEVFYDGLLGRYGFAVNPNTAWLKLRESPSTADLSLRFSSPQTGNNETTWGLIYRIAVVASQDDGNSADDLRWSGDALSLRLAKETGGWLRTAATVYADCELSWDIPDDAIWMDRNTDWSLRTTLRMHWLEQILKSEGIIAAASPTRDFTAGTLPQAAYSFKQVRDSLIPVEAGLPQSFLPDLSVENTQQVRFALYGSPTDARFVDDTGNDIVSWGRPDKRNRVEATFVRPSMRLSLASESDLIESSEDTAHSGDRVLHLTTESQTFFQKPSVADKFVEGTILVKLSHAKDWPPTSANAVSNGEPFFASFKLDSIGSSPSWRGRLSSLQFDWRDPDQAQRMSTWALEPGYLLSGGPGVRHAMDHAAPPIDLEPGLIAASIRMVLQASKVEPLGVDVRRNDRTGRPAPLLIPVSEASLASPTSPKFFLLATETISPTQDRWLEADIKENAADSGDRSYVILSQEPFSVLRFTHRPLSDRGDLGTAAVASYSGDDRIWQFKQVTDHYHYVLPPQSVGESADKPRRLEIHDLAGSPADDAPARPFVADLDADGKPLEIQSGLKRRAVEFRLTPSAEIWIRPSDAARGYFMPESASYDIFRQRGEYGLGAAVSFIRAEFLYGLSVGIDVSKERSIARQARVAEIEALTGKISGRVPGPDADVDLKARWEDLSRAVARRPERLEIWARDPDSAVDFTPARFSEGVSFALRGTALHRAPLTALDAEGDHRALPKIGGEAADLAKDDFSKPRQHPQGLSGGALWPVESVNLFNILVRRPESRGGAIESIAFSPLGGDATQKAEFLNGIVAIISETRNGYVERQKVEVIGRICALWHRAKHVVVYERTVNPSAQFAPKLKDDPDRTRSRRPILRKVREYIELLEPERAYPDFPNAVPRSAGFLERVRFNSKIINVDSAWSSEVGDFGWQIPLWNRLSARERPQVYPMPDAAFVTTAEGEGDKPVVAQECRDPDFLFFFADFTAVTSDTNLWAPLLNLDYANMPAAKAIADEVDKRPEVAADTPHGADPRRKAVSRFLPGLRRFTWRLAPAAQKTAINAARAGRPLYVGLESVSFVRATHVSDNEKKLQQGLEDLLKGVAQLKPVDPEPIMQIAYWQSDGTGGTAGTEDYSNKIAALKGAISAHDLNGVTKGLQDLVDEWNNGQGVATKIVGNLDDAQRKATEFLDPIKKSFGKLSAVKSSCEKLKSDAVGMIQRKEMLVRTALSDWAADAERVLPKLEYQPDPLNPPEPIPNKAVLIEVLLDLSTVYLRPLFSEASQDVGNVQENVEKVRAILLDLDTEFEAVVDRALRRIDQFAAGYDRAKPWSAERTKAFHAGLRACVSNVADDFAGMIEEARQRFAAELNDVGQAIGGHIARALSEISQASGTLLSDVGSLSGMVEPYLVEARGALDTLLPLIDKAVVDIAKAVQAVDGSSATHELKDEAKKALTALNDVAVKAKGSVISVRGQLDQVGKVKDNQLDQLKSLIVDLSSALASIVTEVGNKAEDLVKLAAQFEEEVRSQLEAIWPDVEAGANKITAVIAATLTKLEEKLAEIGKLLDFLVGSITGKIKAVLVTIRTEVRGAEAAIAVPIADVRDALQAVQLALAPGQLLETVVREKIIRPALVEVLQPLTDAAMQDADKALKLIRARLLGLSEAIAEPFRNLNANMLGAMEQVSLACKAAFEGIDQAQAFVEGLANDAKKFYEDKVKELTAALDKGVVGPINAALGDLANSAKSLIAVVQAFDHSVRGLQNDLARSTETARMYADRVFDAAGRIDQGGAMAVPNNILKLYSAVTSAPELAALKANIDRIRSGFDELSDIIDTTKANALFNRMSDELKALGLSLPFDKIGDRLLPADLSNFDIGQVFRNFGGAKLDSLFKGSKLPASVRDAVRVTHDFDAKQARAWVQVDINAPMPGRRSLFTIGPFKADFVDPALTGQVRLEASKDQDKVSETGFGRIATSIDVAVGGQSMVRFDKFGLNFTKEKGLEIEFDPKNIRLNPSFKFIQDFLSNLFPDEIGGLKVIKLDGIPIGIEHEFAVPPLSLTFGTSGVSNISIQNHFRLLAYPDFMLANRFNLSTVERPFIFSIFIIGGTGYIQVDAEYRPFDSELSVAVEAGAGGSATLAFAFGPFVGQVFITLSGALNYRKVIGRPGGGLSISAVLVIAGHVNVAGIVTVGIVLMLRMTYRDSGQVDADGTLAVEIRISRFFKITARAGVQYKLRGGKSETTTSGSVGVEPSDELAAKAKKLQDAADKLQQVRK
ncbi:hypothetical protein [Bradyrhizobium sp. URHA0013]|uniref:hypothetical protein n=1 Tax=Bradyrhizobium sp. URHA0013 TaxID=1380352 RepID=UPI0012DC4E51|nr:hypothetical protein [Bradyrhizobium sp. URHA0013]